MSMQTNVMPIRTTTRSAGPQDGGIGESLQLPLCLRTRKYFGVGLNVHLDARQAPIIGSLVDDLLSAGAGVGILSTLADKSRSRKSCVPQKQGSSDDVTGKTRAAGLAGEEDPI